jgi:hypothetical protein
MSTRNRIAVVLFVCAVGLSWPGGARAVILYSGDTRNGAPDSSSIAYPAWQLEGQVSNGFLGTPIAGQYFVTAAHTFIGPNLNDRLAIIAGQAAPPNLSSTSITFQGQSYGVDTSYATGGVQLDSNSDLAVVKITGTFPTFAQLYSTSDETGKQLVVVGRGTPRGSAVVVGSQTLGWTWGAYDGVQSWGQNTVSAISAQGIGWGDAVAFPFSASDPTTCTMSAGDSGGGLFIQAGGQWRLAGINYAVDGPYSLTGLSSDAGFNAAIFDQRGLYLGGPSWAVVSGPDPVPADAYSTRISSNLSFLEGAIVPEPGMLALFLSALGWIMCRRR